jgi:aerobic-type carbon monoxide dehydrogenase small subunit (CoxS/CutS family)
MKPIAFTLNGTARTLTVGADRMLLWVLRDDLGLTGTKYGCGAAICGSCTVLLDGKAARACTLPMSMVDGKKVVTIEGLADGEHLHPVQQAFVDHAGYQCGFCTPGMIMGAQALLLANPKATRDEIAAGMERHLCRCGAHVRIVDAIAAAVPGTAGGAR